MVYYSGVGKHQLRCGGRCLVAQVGERQRLLRAHFGAHRPLDGLRRAAPVAQRVNRASLRRRRAVRVLRAVALGGQA